MHLIRRRARETPDAIALEHGTRTRTFADLWRWTEDVAAALIECGVGPGDRVALWADRTMATVAAATATMAVRAAYVPLDPVYPRARIDTILGAARPKLVVYDGESGAGPPPPASVPTLDVADVGPAGAGLALEGPREDDVAYVMFTSGSTGRPKGVEIEHRSLVNYASWCASVVGELGIGSPLFGSLGFDHSLTSLWPTLVKGRRVVVAAGVWDSATLFGRGPERFTFMKVTPSHLRFFERTIRPRYAEGYHVLISGGEVLEPTLLAQLGHRLAGMRLVNHYGPTETTIGCCYYTFTIDSLPGTPSVPIGRPVWNTTAYLVDEDLRPVVATGTPAELVVAGPGVARGYVGAPVARDKFVDAGDLGGPPGRAYRTGDWVELLDDGNLLYLGRTDDEVKVNGHRIDLAGLRRTALRVDGVLDVAFDVERGVLDVLVPLVVPNERGRARGAELARAVLSALGDVLPPAVAPRRVRLEPELPMNEHGKADVRATASRRGASPQRVARPGGTRTPVDRDVLVVGAGIAGLAAAARLRDVGLDVDVVEQAPELRATGAGIMLHPNALEHLGYLGPRLFENGATIERQVTIDRDGSSTIVDWGRVWSDGRMPLAIHRRRLAELMCGHLGQGAVRWSTAPVSLRASDDAVAVGFDDGSRRRYRLVVAADGVNSWTRRLLDATTRPTYLGQTYWRTTIAARAPLAFAEWRVWRAEGHFFGAMPIGGGRMHVFLQAAQPAARDVPAKRAWEELLRLGRGMGDSVRLLIEALDRDEEIDVRPAYGLLAARWTHGRIAIVGDAAHAASPATTQGGALAIEDAAVLADEIGRHGANPAALAAFEKRRRPRVAAFARLARQHVALMEMVQAGVAQESPRRDGAIWFRRLYAPLMDAA
ncbi:MAG TPA: amino acid adenylation domain-containing protein [Actinomycetota bacterium]|nr:amino acid adenylation domain-containing protein [Actinomycetota bacterium]